MYHNRTAQENNKTTVTGDVVACSEKRFGDTLSACSQLFPKPQTANEY